jgi:DNA-binding NarL/FixJ family response regulator
MVAVSQPHAGAIETTEGKENARLTYVLVIDAERQADVDALIAQIPDSSFYLVRSNRDCPGEIPTGELSQRLEQVLRLLAQGMSNKTIGRQLGISHFTVRNHVARLLRMYAVRNRDELMALTQALRPV